jgi:plastocyanin
MATRFGHSQSDLTPDLGGERILLRNHFLVAMAAAAAVVLAAFGPGLASAETAPTGTTDTISIRDVKGALKFVAPPSVHVGDELEIINETDPHRVGPHTFSLVTKGSVPKTPSARKNCFTPKHICLSISKWHGFDPKTEKITVNPATAGPEGWSTLGSTTKKGDSWFTGEKKSGTSITQRVTADPATTGTLYFVCAIHPWMHGQTQVLPAATTTPLPTGSY